MLQILTGGSSTRFHPSILHTSPSVTGRDRPHSVLPEGRSLGSLTYRLDSSVFGAVGGFPVLDEPESTWYFDPARQHPCRRVMVDFSPRHLFPLALCSISLSILGPQKKKTKPHRSSGSRHTRRTDTRAAQRSTSTKHSRAEKHKHTTTWGWLLGPFLPFFSFFPCFDLCLILFLFFFPSLPVSKKNIKLTLLTFSLARSFNSSRSVPSQPSLDFTPFRFASLFCVSSSFHQNPFLGS